MANTYTQLYFHIVFAVKGRQSLIATNWKDQLYKYISGIIRNQNQKLMIINGVPDHVHLLIGTKPDCNLSDLVRVIKSSSSKWINDEKLVQGKFAWQIGFGAFTLGQSQLPRIINYIETQEEHHKTKTFKDEYETFLKAYQIDFKPQYVFDEIKK